MIGSRHFSRFLASAVLICGLALSCTKEERPSFVPDEQMEVTFLSEGLSPMRNSQGGGNGGFLQLFVYRTIDGIIAVYNCSKSDAAMTVTVPSGPEVDWFLTGNLPAGIVASDTREEFVSQVIRLDETDPENPPVFSSGTQTFVPTVWTVNTHLSRYTCKISVKDISVPYLESFSSVPSCRLDCVALLNVVGTIPVTGVPTAGAVWYNRSGIDELSDAMKGMLVWDTGLDIASGTTVNVEANFSAMPNPLTGGDYGLPWSERGTRIALCLSIAGEPNWYAIDLPSMEGNRHYTVSEVVITGPGTASPDEPVERSSMRFGVEVLEWGETSQETQI